MAARVGGDGHWSATNSYGTTAYHTTGYGTTAYGTTAYDGLLRRNLRRVPSTYHRELLRQWVLQLRRLVHCRRAAAGAAVGVVAGAAVASANTSAATSSAYSAGYAAGTTLRMR